VAVPTIAFTSDPAGITVGEGLSLSARYWRATADLWMLPVAIVAAVTAVATWLAARLVPAPGLPATYLPGTDPMTVIGPLLPQLLLTGILATGVSMVAGWVYLAIAIAGLRGYRVMPGWILRRGVRVLAVDLLLSAAFVVVFGILAVFSLVGGPGLLVVVMVTAFVPAIYLSVRLVFWSLAIFDGAGIGEGLDATWRITRGSVPRLLGWGFAVALIGLVARLVEELVTSPLGSGNPIRPGIAAAVTEAASAFSTIVLAVVYESQRRRAVLLSPVVPPPAPARMHPFDPPPPPNR
jgi:hypothetical protein